MIKHWNEICDKINEAENKLQEFILSAGLSALQVKKLEKFTKDWNKTKQLAEQFDKFISPVDPIKIESPFDQKDFRYIWKMWKEYLAEQHGILMRSRMEQAGLDYLSEISENNVDKALKYIRFAMAKGYKSFFIVEEKDNSKPSKSNDDDSDF